MRVPGTGTHDLIPAADFAAEEAGSLSGVDHADTGAGIT